MELHREEINTVGYLRTSPTWQNYHQTLLNNKARSQGSNTMTIELEGTTLKVVLNGSQSYQDSAYVFGGDKHLYIQSHWGSGVVFTSAKLVLE